jgi:hypothetical protein
VPHTLAFDHERMAFIVADRYEDMAAMPAPIKNKSVATTSYLLATNEE